jgi:hypothetical protein
MSTKCNRCNRNLKNPIYVKIGMGKVCLSKVRGDSERQESLFDQSNTPVIVPPLRSKRIQLRRSKGWKMPVNTIKVDRSTPLGNPFIVGIHGTTKECVRLFELLCTGLVCASVDKKCFQRQTRFLKYLKENKDRLKGKNLGCWCHHSNVCHVDTLLKIING